MRGTKASVLVGAVGAVLMMAGPRAQQPTQPPPERPTFRAEVGLVEVSAVVTGDGDRPIVDLSPDDFEVLEDGQQRPIVSARFLSPSSTSTAARQPLPASLAGARLDEVVTNRDLADAPAFVLLLDDLNVSAYDSHRAIRAGLGVLGALPTDALVSVVNTSGEGGALVTLGRPSQTHVERVRAFRGQYLLTRSGSAGPSWVDTPCSGGADSPDCLDPTRVARRSQALEAVGELFSRTGSRRKVLFWFVTDMGVSPLDPERNRDAQFAGLQRLLGGDVTVYAVDPRENVAPTDGSSPVFNDRRTGGRMRVGMADSQFGGRGGATMSLNTDDMVGVPLTQITRETGGRWIQNANNVDKLVAEVVTQNLSAYVLAYESSVWKVEGRHSIEVKVKRRGAKVSARRGFVVAPADRAAELPPASTDIATSRLREVISGGVPFGTLALKVQVAPQFADVGPARALVTLQVDEGTATDASSIDLLVLAADDTGQVGSVERFAMRRPSTDVPWEGSVTLALARGQYQLRIAASTPDGRRTGLLLHPIDMRAPSGDLVLGVPTLLAGDETGVRPTLVRSFPAGHPLAYQVELAGDAVGRGTATLHGRLVDAAGVDVRAESATTEPADGPARLRATGRVSTDGVAPGAYTLLVEARPGPGGRAVTHAIPVRLDAPLAGAAPGTRAAVTRTLTPLSVAHGPFTRHAQQGPRVIRTESEWRAFWLALPTRQAAPDIDFARVTLVAIVSDDAGVRPGTPRITEVQTEPGGVMVRWTTRPSEGAASPASSDPRRPFLVVGLTGHTGRVRFERVD
jgi:VWFA-related protein